uniref:Uncharacterized protein n=1 Tax=Salix viminalis TaxID=40686 RepID=A0A6N2KSB8_SALVM
MLILICASTGSGHGKAWTSNWKMVNMILLRVNKARVQTVGKDIMHFFRVIWVQFIQPLLSLLGILIRLLQQIQPTEQNSMQILFATRAIITLSVWDVQSCGTLFGQCLT